MSDWEWRPKGNKRELFWDLLTVAAIFGGVILFIWCAHWVVSAIVSFLVG